ncbi:MAG: hypothetical protein IPJ13_09210 [Saprospiraceae bacterium]|nr:hypothetical protein [Saprospiraceae bacterium]
MQYQLDPEFKFKYLIDHNSNMIKNMMNTEILNIMKVPTIEKGKVMIGARKN